MPSRRCVNDGLRMARSRETLVTEDAGVHAETMAMKILCLGGGGRICRESILDLVEFSSFDRITIADVNSRAAKEVAVWLADSRVDFVDVDARDQQQTIELMRGYDIVMDGTPISMNDLTTECVARAGVHGINLNGMSHEWDFDESISKCRKDLCARIWDDSRYYQHDGDPCGKQATNRGLGPLQPRSVPPDCLLRGHRRDDPH